MRLFLYCRRVVLYPNILTRCVHGKHNISSHAHQARSQPSDDGGSFSLDFGPFSGFENWSSQWLSRGNLDF